MLYISIVVSLIMLLSANVYVLWSKKPLCAIPVVVPFAALFACNGLLVPYGVILQALTLVVLSTCCSFPKRRPKFFAVVSCVGTLLIYVSLTWFAIRQTVNLQNQFPFVSMKDRIAVPKPSDRKTKLPASALAQMEQFEDMVANHKSKPEWLAAERLELLKEIHERTLERFVNSEGFGASRMHAMRRAQLQLAMKRKPVPKLRQPGVRLSAEWFSGTMSDPFVKSKNDSTAAWLRLHQFTLLDFVNRDGFGYFRDRQHVAGFESHRFSKEPEPLEPWKLQTIELIGLVMHEKPIAYISDNLPRMDELRKAPTRSLDEFESLGLKSLRRGDDLFVRDLPAGRRMLGAIRSAKQCVDCHGGKRGDLLGAFSYTMTK